MWEDLAKGHRSIGSITGWLGVVLRKKNSIGAHALKIIIFLWRNQCKAPILEPLQQPFVVK
jgi:hypothetical protein